MLKHYHSLVPLGQEARKPIFLLKPADGAIGAHQAAVLVGVVRGRAEPSSQRCDNRDGCWVAMMCAGECRRPVGQGNVTGAAGTSGWHFCTPRGLVCERLRDIKDAIASICDHLASVEAKTTA